MDSFWKLVFRQISTHKGRFITLILIVALGIAFFSGLRSTTSYMELRTDTYFDNQLVMDLEILSPIGLSDADIETLKDRPDLSQVMRYSEWEETVNQHAVKVIVQPFHEVNQPLLKAGRFPLNPMECMMDSQLASFYTIGESLTLHNESYKIVGIANYPLFITKNLGKSQSGSNWDGFVLIDENPTVVNQLMVTMNRDNNSRFTSSYLQSVQNLSEQLKNDHPDWIITNLFSIQSINGYKEDLQRITSLSIVFPLLFFIVTILMSLNNITRMVEHDRGEIGTLLSLGYSRLSILCKYLVYTLLACMIGSLVGLSLGFYGFPRIIDSAYGILYRLPPLKTPILMTLSLASFSILTLCVTIPALYACLHVFKRMPATLLRPKSPKSGKRIILERFPFLWKKLRFLHKITLRNIFRYKKRFVMTLIGIAGSCALLYTGFGLRDSIQSMSTRQFSSIQTYDVEIYIAPSTAFENTGLIEQRLINHQSVSAQTPHDMIDEVNLIVPQTDLSGFINTGGSLPNSGVVITRKCAMLLQLNVHDTFTIILNDQSYLVSVARISDNYLSHYIYLSSSSYESIFHNSPTYQSVLGQMAEGETATNLSASLSQNPNVLGELYTQDIIDQMDDMVNMLNTVVWVLIGSAALLTFLVLFTLTQINIEERNKELATIKVLGFYDEEMNAYIFRENWILTFMGILLGLLLGFFLHRYVLQTAETDELLFVRSVKGWSYLISFLLTLLFAFIVNLVLSLRLKHIKMSESLKSIE